VAIIRLESIVKVVGGEKILDGVGLSIGYGEVVVVRGKSGVGKTTLAKIAALLSKPDQGKIYFLGQDVTVASEGKRSLIRLNHIGYIDQHFKLLPEITVLENVELPLTLAGLPRAERRRRAIKILEELGLGDKVDRYPDELSGGERQRVAIARALVKEPTLIVGDEPLSNLDNITASTVMEVIRGMARRGAGVLITTTDLYSRLDADKDLILINGKLYRAGEGRW